MKIIYSISIFIACLTVFVPFFFASDAVSKISDTNNCFAMKLFSK